MNSTDAACRLGCRFYCSWKRIIVDMTQHSKAR